MPSLPNYGGALERLQPYDLPVRMNNLFVVDEYTNDYRSDVAKSSAMSAPQSGKHANVQFGTRNDLWTKRTKLLKNKFHRMWPQQFDSVHSPRQLKTCCIMKKWAVSIMLTLNGPGETEAVCNVMFAPIIYPNTFLYAGTAG